MTDPSLGYKRVWHTKDGQRLFISKMTTQHIRNCHRMLVRYQDRRIDFLGEQGAFLHGEAAVDHFDDRYDDLLENGFGEDDPIQQFIDTFEHELLKRGEEI